MKKIIFIILLFVSASAIGQQKTKYAERLNANGTIDSFYVKQFTDSVFAYSNDAFVAFTVEHYARIFGSEPPEGMGNFHPTAGGLPFKNYIQRAEAVAPSGIDGISTVGTNLLAISNPASASLIRVNANGTTVTRTVTEAKQDLSIENVTNESKATMFTSPAFTGTPTGITAAHVGLSNVDNTSDANKPVSTATQTALNNKSTIHFGLDAGANDSYVITASPAPAAYTQGMVVMFRANTQNTTGCTINVNSLGVKTIVKRVSTTPATGDILSQMFCWLIYDGTQFVILNPVAN